jgi:hypothetical protein
VAGAACEADFAGVAGGGAADDAHGRHEGRYVSVYADPAGIPAGWPDVAAVVQVNRERGVGGQRTCTAHFYLTSCAGTAAEMAALVRGHWGIESGRSEDWRSDNLCAPGRYGYHLHRRPARVGRVVRPTL